MNIKVYVHGCLGFHLIVQALPDVLELLYVHFVAELHAAGRHQFSNPS